MTALDLAAYTMHLAQRRGGGTLQWGSRNPRAVKALQERLTQLGYATEVDGQWGAETERQFRSFQHATGLKTDGKLGPKSLDQLLKSKPKDANAADPGLDAITKVVASGSPQSARRTAGLGEIKAEQAGGGSASQGHAPGGSTPAAPKAPTGAHGGAIDPATGAETASSKTGPIGTTDPAHAHTPGAAPQDTTQPVDPEFEKLHPRDGGKFAKKGDSGAQVSNTQQALNSADKAGLKQDGQFGDKTEAAVKSFQQAAGITVDGVVGPETSGALRRKLNAIKRVKAGDHAGAKAP